jgi:chromosome segregation ATPase
MLLESIKSYFEQEGSLSRPWSNLNESLNRILENYKNENRLLRTNYHEKIKYYQEQLKNTKNEIYDNFLKMMEIKNKNEKEINDIKNDYDKKMEDVNHKNQIIDHFLNLCQEANNNLMNRICQINQKVSAKEMKIIQLQEENQQLKDKIEELYTIKKNINSKDKNIDLKLKEENKELNKKLDEQNQANEKLKEELKGITNERDLYHQRLLSLGIRFVGVNEFQTTRDEAFDRFHEEIEQLKGQNENLKGMIETLTKDFLAQQEQKTEIIENYGHDEDLKKQYDEIEGLKEMTFKIINEKNNNDDQDTFRKENEQLTEQIMKISNEYNVLQKEYNILNNKYKKLLKNENKNMLNSSNNTNSITTISNNDNELKKVKEENEKIKQKNMALEKEISRNYYDAKSEDGLKSNYEEEFDLRKMAKGAKDKNRSQDLNIDYPGIQALKEKYRELDFNYNSLEILVKQLLFTIQVNPQNRTNVIDLCKLLGFDNETTNKILNNKYKNSLLDLYPK